jgi:hypothetical protein
LKNQAEWKQWAKTDQKPADIPGDPYKVYKAEWRSWGDWIGTDYIAGQYRQYRPFEEAREFVRGLGLKSQKEWLLYGKTDQKPADIPAYPESFYKNEWLGLRDWLGTTDYVHPRPRNWRPRPRSWRRFEEAREFVRGLGLKRKSEWVEWIKSDQKPDDIPASPGTVYKAQWQGWGDWLGTGNVAAQTRVYRPFEEALHRTCPCPSIRSRPRESRR